MKSYTSLYKSFTIWITTIGLTLYYLIDSNPELVTTMLVEILPFSETVIVKWINSYDKIMLVFTLIGTSYGRARTESINIPLSERNSKFTEADFDQF